MARPPSPKYDGMTLEEVAHAEGLTQERVRQIEHKALRKLRNLLKPRNAKARQRCGLRTVDISTLIPKSRPEEWTDGRVRPRPALSQLDNGGRGFWPRVL